MQQRSITKEDVKRIISRGMKWQGRDDKWHAEMEGIEAVFQKREDCFIVITVYWSD
jgi:hypothetical protein